MVSNFLFNFTNFCVKSDFFIKPLTSGILFSTAVDSELVPRPVILGNFGIKISFLTKPDQNLIHFFYICFF